MTERTKSLAIKITQFRGNAKAVSTAWLTLDTLPCFKIFSPASLDFNLPLANLCFNILNTYSLSKPT